MSAPSPVLVAASPELKAALQAVMTFVANLGPDPTKFIVTAAPALQVMLGTLGLQVPALVNAEWAAVQTEINAKLTAAIAKLP